MYLFYKHELDVEEREVRHFSINFNIRIINFNYQASKKAYEVLNTCTRVVT